MRIFRLADSPAPAAEQTAPRDSVAHLRRRARIALVALVSLLALSQLAVQPEITNLAVGVPFINSYGRQRMLSQRLVKAALALPHSRTPTERTRRINEISQTLAEWSRQHAQLRRDSSYLRTGEIVTAKRALDEHFHRMEAAARQLIGSLAEDQAAAVAAATGQLLDTEPLYLERMDQIVGLYETEVGERTGGLRKAGWAIFGLIVAVALFLHRNVVSPAIGVLSNQYQANFSRYRTLVENMNDGLALVDRQGTVELANRRLLAMLQLGEEQLLQQRIDEFVVPAAGSRTALLQALRHQGTVELQLRPAGDRPPIDAVVRSRLVDAEGTENPTILVVITDITEEKAGRERLNELQDQLAHVNRLKTVGEMSATLAHELGQPLCAISAFIGGCRRQLAAGETSTEKLQEQLERVDLAATRAADILKRFRGYGRHASQAMKPLDFAAIAGEVRELCTPLLAENSVQLTSSLDKSLPLVLGDHLLIQQVIVNLIQNAVQSLGGLADARRTVTLRIAARDAGVEISVEDQGEGIPAAVMPRLLKPFFTTRAGGLGLGLAICRTIIEEHEGHLCFTSEEGTGTTVRVTLPAAIRESSHA